MALRKYPSEFMLNMLGSNPVLLQQDGLKEFSESKVARERKLHIYMVCRQPRIALNPESLKITSTEISGELTVQQQNIFTPYQFVIPHEFDINDVKLRSEYPHTELSVTDNSGALIAHKKLPILILQFCPELHDLLKLEVLYIGQAYGNEGSRTATTRLLHHEKLQFIYSQAISRSPDQEIWLLLWDFERIYIQTIVPYEVQSGVSETENFDHILRVLKDDMSKEQEVTFTEAALIKYFQPEYNKEYKESFPNKDHKSYSECYQLDLNAVNIELQTEIINSQLWSSTASPRLIHFAFHHLHSLEERKGLLDFGFATSDDDA